MDQFSWCPAERACSLATFRGGDFHIDGMSARGHRLNPMQLRNLYRRLSIELRTGLELRPTYASTQEAPRKPTAIHDHALPASSRHIRKKQAILKTVIVDPLARITDITRYVCEKVQESDWGEAEVQVYVSQISFGTEGPLRLHDAAKRVFHSTKTVPIY